ncbi:TBC1 domain family member 13 isoform X2 [Colias croceus]|uniref:TBC1 domain family member 13 isoform X2 n=1 Tax=Colias crocea TaxID=72248 RepID=UPI001E27BDCD|nr:TBC1 domain family member 13 isoform X2 [Colias croceus]
MSLYRARIQAFKDLLAKDEVDMKALQKLAFKGVPDKKGLRSLVWKILLHYIPPEKNSWESYLQKKRQLYKQLIDEIIVSPGGPKDHPLSISPGSSWSEYFKDNDVLLQIDKDVRRLCPDISFFQTATEFPCLVLSNEIRRSESLTSGDYAPLNEGCEAHWEVVERMMFLYAKLNPGQGYVQGMNEIIGPIYHTFAMDPDEEFRKHAEADCFFCFTNLMAEIRDFFIRALDETESGINYMMAKLNNCLKRNDRAVWDRLEKQELRPQYYSFRWLSLLLSREFSLPDVERIWDSLFADTNRFDFLINVACAMIILIRDDLLTGDFGSNVQLLQNFPPMDVSLILNKAVQIAND